MGKPRTIIEKMWDQHTVDTNAAGYTLLYVDYLMFGESQFSAFEILAAEGLKVRCPKQVFGTSDHYAPSRGATLADVVDDERRNLIMTLGRNASRHGFSFFGLGDPRRGIQHLVGPEQGLAQPGVLILCSDSHTATQGAVGALAFGIGGELAHVLATQTIWQRKPKQMRVTVDGVLGRGISAKDVSLTIVARVGAGGGAQHAIEYSGDTIRRMSMEERMTVCNMSIEAGSRIGCVAPDEKTFAYVEGRPYAPSDEGQWSAARHYWAQLKSDEGALWDKEVKLDAGGISPMVTWGNSPEDGVPITGIVPDPDDEVDELRRIGMRRSLDYMGLKVGMRMRDVKIDQVFIGSCTNSRLEDLRAAAEIIYGRKAVVPALVVPGSTGVKRQAEEEGLDRIFKGAGFEWGEAGCSMCVSLNGDTVPAGKRCASTSNRNFAGRQGAGSRTHLMSPAMAAVAALTGRLTDVREFLP